MKNLTITTMAYSNKISNKPNGDGYATYAHLSRRSVLGGVLFALLRLANLGTCRGGALLAHQRLANLDTSGRENNCIELHRHPN
jgi:hypothetical protein